jgi:hypothetical protein
MSLRLSATVNEKGLDYKRACRRLFILRVMKRIGDDVNSDIATACDQPASIRFTISVGPVGASVKLMGDDATDCLATSSAVFVTGSILFSQ